MVGQLILHYSILEKLGEGAMGVVYLAEDTKLNRKVALKFLPGYIRNSDEEYERFKTEARAAAALNHPNITQIYSIEETGDQIFIVMEYVQGKLLKELIQSQSLAPDARMHVALQICSALKVAHDTGIIHRDIKSSNIMLDENGNAKIMDFGVAKILGSTELTRPGTTIGTMAYISPEQITGQSADQQSDIWSFGVLLYELFTGRLPFDGIYEQALMYSILEEEPIPASQVAPDIPEQIDQIIGKCLLKDRENRYTAFGNIVSDLSEPKPVVTPKQNRSTQKHSNRNVSVKKSLKLAYLWIGFPVVLLALLLLYPSSPATIRNWLGFGKKTSQHILILPFNNIGGGKKSQSLCDGLMETLSSKITELEKFHGNLWVVPASEVKEYQIDTPGEANKAFGVNLVVTGSLQFLQDDARLTLNLVDAKKLIQLSSSVIDAPVSNLITLQNSSVTKLLNMLDVELTPSISEVIREGGTTVPGAYEFYLQGISYLRRYENEANIDNAIRLLKNAIDADTSYALAYAALGEAYWRKYEANKDAQYVTMARSICVKALDINDKLAPVNVTMGLINLGTGDYKEAARHFREALKMDPENADAYRGLANTYEAQNLFEKAEATYLQAIRLKPDYWAGYSDLGVFYYKHSQYEKAIDEFKQVIQLTPDNYRGYSNLGGIYYLLQKWPEAIDILEHSMTLKKNYPAASNLGTLYFNKGDYKKASRMYETALELNQNDYTVWGNLAAAYYRTPGERDKAIPTYKKAIQVAEDYLKINPKDAEAVASLAAFYAETGNKNKSLSLVKQSLKLAADDPPVMFWSGSTYEKLGDRDKALYWIGKALDNGYSTSDIINQPDLKDLVADQRFKEMIEKQK